MENLKNWNRFTQIDWGQSDFTQVKMNEKFSNVLENKFTDFQNFITFLENENLVIDNSYIYIYEECQRTQEFDKMTPEIIQFLKQNTIEDYQGSFLDRKKLELFLNNPPVANLQVLSPFQVFSQKNTNQSTWMTTDSVVYTDNNREKVFKVYVRWLSSEMIQKYYAIQNSINEVCEFEVKNKEFGKKKIQLRFDTSHNLMNVGKNFVYGMQDFCDGKLIHKEYGLGLYMDIAAQMNAWLYEKYQIRRDSSVDPFNMKIIEDWTEWMIIQVTDIGANIRDFVQKNS